MLPGWRTFVGPLVTLTTVSAILFVDRNMFPVPNPGAISFLAVIFSAYFGGLTSGLVSAAISLGYAAIHFSIPGQFLHFKPENLARIWVLVLATPICAILVGVLHGRAARALERERRVRETVERINAELLTLRSAVEQSEFGVVLLDRELRAQFINRTFRRIWQLPDEVADSKPAFVGLMYHGRDTGAYSVPPHELDQYVAQRVALVQAGDEQPIDLRLANGDVLRFRCKALADGGRMLTYGIVTDLVHQADELSQLAMVDGLTGIYNRRHFLALLDVEWDRYQRYGRPLSLLILDIDLFKTVNDRFGHDAGDQVLMYFAQVCHKGKRSADVLGRIGGEEFALLLPETDLAEARAVAERLRKTVAERSVPCGKTDIGVTVSIGVATADANMTGPSQLMKAADEALYAAKKAGRNRVYCPLVIRAA